MPCRGTTAFPSTTRRSRFHDCNAMALSRVRTSSAATATTLMHYRLPNLTLDVVGRSAAWMTAYRAWRLYAMLYLSPGSVTLQAVRRVV